MLDTNDILDTIRMISDENLDVRTVTMGISLLDCADADSHRACEKIYNKITSRAKNLVRTAERISATYGMPIVNKRVSVAPIAMLVGGYPTQQQKERRQTPRFSVDDLVHENGYDLEKSGRMPDMLRERDDWSDNYAQHVKAFCERKYNSAFSVEMSRSVKAMLDAWVNAGTEEKI